MAEREQFEAHIKNTAWYRTLSESAKEDDEGASVFRMAHMAASEAWQASRRAVLEEATAAIHAEQLSDPTDSPDDIAYGHAVRDCEAAVRALADGDKA